MTARSNSSATTHRARARQRTLAAMMMWPTLFVAAAWAASPFMPKVQPGWRTPGWDFRLVTHSIRIEQVYPIVPISALHAGTVPPGWGLIGYRGSGSYLFGCVSIHNGGMYNATMAQSVRVIWINLIVPLLITFPLAWAGARLWRRPSIEESRRRHRQCIACGYNLTGNVSGVCPECGTAVPPAAGGGQQAGKGATA